MLVKFNFRIATSIILGCALWWKIVISCDSVNYLNHLRFMHKVLFWIIPRFSFFLQKNVANNFSGSSISSVMSVYPLKFIDFFFSSPKYRKLEFGYSFYAPKLTMTHFGLHAQNFCFSCPNVLRFLHNAHANIEFC